MVALPPNDSHIWQYILYRWQRLGCEVQCVNYDNQKLVFYSPPNEPVLYARCYDDAVGIRTAAIATDDAYGTIVCFDQSHIVHNPTDYEPPIQHQTYKCIVPKNYVFDDLEQLLMPAARVMAGLRKLLLKDPFIESMLSTMQRDRQLVARRHDLLIYKPPKCHSTYITIVSELRPAVLIFTNEHLFDFIEEMGTTHYLDLTDCDPQMLPTFDQTIIDCIGDEIAVVENILLYQDFDDEVAFTYPWPVESPEVTFTAVHVIRGEMKPGKNYTIQIPQDVKQFTIAEPIPMDVLVGLTGTDFLDIIRDLLRYSPAPTIQIDDHKYLVVTDGENIFAGRCDNMPLSRLIINNHNLIDGFMIEHESYCVEYVPGTRTITIEMSLHDVPMSSEDLRAPSMTWGGWAYKKIIDIMRLFLQQ